MTRFIPFIAVLLAACASPKYTYYFDHYTATSGPDALSSGRNKPLDTPLTVDSKDLSANTGPVAPVQVPADATAEMPSRGGRESQYSGQMKRAKLRQDRKQIVQAIKQLRKELLHTKNSPSKPATILNGQATQKLDNEVIVAIAFGAVGITLSLLGGISAAFWIAGVLCLGVGVYFFVDWLSKR
ncbi:MAG TPA: hypothetical protein VK658_15085 [Chryseolinea sp.]|nr:hypothetical protein [Chryseolinea sp.]